MSSRFTCGALPSPTKLIRFLKTNPPKGHGQFFGLRVVERKVDDDGCLAVRTVVDPEAGCCLGHYARLAGRKVDPESIVFNPTSSPNRTTADRGKPLLPATHWLFLKNPDTDHSYQQELADLNDEHDTWDPIIAYLEDVVLANANRTEVKQS